MLDFIVVSVMVDEYSSDVPDGRAADACRLIDRPGRGAAETSMRRRNPAPARASRFPAGPRDGLASAWEYRNYVHKAGRAAPRPAISR
ncbi:hypothetical protein [Bordetella genomosp. 10]|uniref:hypothetical protein n=1 Tax=Bordetella genomosp. 10 TaxID=1416804 RepID=UPI0011777332|nr:hypothetical protein [Bordetella genomosp. 10]